MLDSVPTTIRRYPSPDDSLSDTKQQYPDEGLLVFAILALAKSTEDPT